MIEIKTLTSRRFEALAGYARSPKIVLHIEEIEWYATPDERLIGTLERDRIDHDVGWVILGRDERRRFRAIEVNVSLSAGESAVNLTLVATALAANIAAITSAIALDQSLPACQAVGDVSGKIKSVGFSRISGRLIVTLPKA